MKDIFWCKNCLNMSTRPRIEFNSKGWCNACHWMEEKKGRSYHKSEPESLIEIMNRHEDWCVVVCLIGGGQEIYDGEAGLIEWFETVKKKFSDWKAYFPQQILSMGEYCPNKINFFLTNDENLSFDDVENMRPDYEIILNGITDNNILSEEIYP